MLSRLICTSRRTSKQTEFVPPAFLNCRRAHTNVQWWYSFNSDICQEYLLAPPTYLEDLPEPTLIITKRTSLKPNMLLAPGRECVSR